MHLCFWELEAEVINMKRTTFLIMLVFSVCFGQGICANSDSGAVVPIENKTTLQGKEYPLWSGYIKNFYNDDRYYITYQEEGSRQMVLYCTQSVFKSLRDDYGVMIEAAVKVKRGEFDYAALVILESCFQEKYTYSQRSNGEWWITKH